MSIATGITIRKITSAILFAQISTMAAAEKGSAPRSVTVPNQVLTRWEDLSEVGCTKSALYEKYREIYNSAPDSISINEGICMDYGHYCYTIQESCSYTDQRQSTVMATGDVKELINNTNHPMTYHVQLKTAKTKYATVTVARKSQFSFRNKIVVSTSELGIQNEFDDSFSFQNSIGSTSSASENVEVTGSVDVTLQPGQRAVAVLDITWTEIKKHFTIPFTVDGWCVATFPKAVNGHRFWFSDISSLFPTPQSSLSGSVECVCDIKSSVSVKHDDVV